jgi:hypothetical protein
VTAEEWALAASAFFSGLASGLLGMLSTILRPMLAAMDGRDFRNFMGAFLRFAEKSSGRVFNFAWSLGMGIGPIVALVLLWDDPGSTSFVLTAIGLGIVIIGVYVVANVWKEPHYKVILAWDPEAMPENWEPGRRRYFAINWIQLPARPQCPSPIRSPGSRARFEITPQENWIGRRSRHGRASSNCAASLRITSSPLGGPTSWTPIGSPPGLTPIGSVMLGWPVQP